MPAEQVAVGSTGVPESVATQAELGMEMTSPMPMKFAFVMEGLTKSIWSRVTPFAVAIAPRVSPETTVTVLTISQLAWASTDEKSAAAERRKAE